MRLVTSAFSENSSLEQWLENENGSEDAKHRNISSHSLTHSLVHKACDLLMFVLRWRKYAVLKGG